MNKLKLLVSLTAIALVVVETACSSADAVSATVTYLNDYTLVGQKNFLTGYDTKNADGTYNMAVEIPTGTSQKWETCTTASLTDPVAFPGCTVAGKEMVHEVKAGARRVLKHIGYPGNYGSLPKTKGADGDPLDIVAIGPAADRGVILPVKVVGVIRCLDGADQDDKVVAITAGSPLYASVSTASQLEAAAPKAAELLLTWYQNYKGAGAMTCTPMADETAAATIISDAQAAYTASGI